jgi:hypothetical protein
MCNNELLYICISSNKFDLKRTIRVFHTGGQRFDGPRSVTKYDKKWIKSITDWQHTFPLEKTEECRTKNDMASYRNKNLCFYCKRFNHRQEDCRTRIQDGQPCTDNRGRKYWPKRYTDEEGTQGQGQTSPISALKSYVTPLLGSSSVLTQILLNLCLASLTTCSKIYDIFAPGEKVRPRVNVRTGNQTTSWLFDTGAAIKQQYRYISVRPS